MPSLGSIFFASSNLGCAPFCESLNTIISGNFKSFAGTVAVRVSPGYFFLRATDVSIGQGSFGMFWSFGGPSFLEPKLGSALGASASLGYPPFKESLNGLSSTYLSDLTTLVIDSPGCFFLKPMESSIGHCSLGMAGSFLAPTYYPSFGSLFGASLSFGSAPFRESLNGLSSATFAPVFLTTAATCSPGCDFLSWIDLSIGSSLNLEAMSLSTTYLISACDFSLVCNF